MQCLFRKPIFPIICDIEGELIVAVSLDDFENQLKNFKLKPNHIYSTIDSKVEGWFLNVEPLIVSPLAIKKKWTQKTLINLYNKSKNSKNDRNIYFEKSNMSLEVVFNEIIELLEAH